MTITTSDVDDVLAACIAAGLPHPRGIVTDGTAIRFHMATAADVDTYAERLDASPVVDATRRSSSSRPTATRSSSPGPPHDR